MPIPCSCWASETRSWGTTAQAWSWPTASRNGTTARWSTWRKGALPGTVVTRSREELPRHFSRVMSPHQIGMKEVLGAAQLCGTLPRAITLVGVEALHTDFCRPMSAEVQEALPKALDTAEALIARALAEHQARKNAHA